MLVTLFSMVILAWDRPIFWTDGRPVLQGEIAYYKIYQRHNDLVLDPMLWPWRIIPLYPPAEGKNCFSVATVPIDPNAAESDRSEEFCMAAP